MEKGEVINVAALHAVLDAIVAEDVDGAEEDNERLPDSTTSDLFQFDLLFNLPGPLIVQ